MDFVYILVLVAAVAVGVTSAVARTWALHSRTYSLEDRVGILEGIQQREVKIRAAETRWRKPSADEAAIAAAIANPPEPKSKVPWYKSPNLPKRSYAP
jgi:hypothetical protein